VFIERLTRAFSTRVYREQSPGFAEGPSSDEEDDPLAGSAAGVGPPPQSNGHRPVAESLPPLSKETQTRVAELVVRLASKSQYAKVSSLWFCGMRTPLCRCVWWGERGGGVYLAMQVFSWRSSRGTPRSARCVPWGEALL